jgi:hypothetical protein
MFLPNIAEAWGQVALVDKDELLGKFLCAEDDILNNWVK